MFYFGAETKLILIKYSRYLAKDCLILFYCYYVFLGFEVKQQILNLLLQVQLKSQVYNSDFRPHCAYVSVRGRVYGCVCAFVQYTPTVRVTFCTRGLDCTRFTRLSVVASYDFSITRNFILLRPSHLFQPCVCIDFNLRPRYIPSISHFLSAHARGSFSLSPPLLLSGLCTSLRQAPRHTEINS